MLWLALLCCCFVSRFPKKRSHAEENSLMLTTFACKVDKLLKTAYLTKFFKQIAIFKMLLAVLMAINLEVERTSFCVSVHLRF